MTKPDAMDGKLPIDDKIGEQLTPEKVTKYCKTMDCKNCPLWEMNWCKEMLRSWINDELEGF